MRKKSITFKMSPLSASRPLAGAAERTGVMRRGGGGVARPSGMKAIDKHISTVASSPRHRRYRSSRGAVIAKSGEGTGRLSLPSAGRAVKIISYRR